MKKRILIFVTILMILVVVIVFCINNIFGVKKDNVILSRKVDENYIAVFNGGAGEQTYSTYIYKIDNGYNNYGFRYINTTNTTEHYGSPNWYVVVTETGKFNFPIDAFSIAKKNYAYSYVKVPGENNTYSIREFKRMFLLN